MNHGAAMRANRRRRPSGETQAQDRPRLAQGEQPEHDHQAGQDDADQALREHAERRAGPGEDERCGAGAPSRSASAASAAKTIVSVMHAATGMSRFAKCAATKKNGIVASTRTVAPATAAPAAAARRCPEAEHRQARQEERRQPGRRDVDAEGVHRQRGQPVEERRLVEERQPVLHRHEPVAGAHHLPGDSDVASFVGQCQRMQADREGEPRDEGERRHEVARVPTPSMRGNGRAQRSDGGFLRRAQEGQEQRSADRPVDDRRPESSRSRTGRLASCARC